jgi:DNA-3-methyladenine glycosylase II
MKKSGLSTNKTNYILDLSKKFNDGTLSDKIILSLSDEEVSKKLIEVKGIGQVIHKIIIKLLVI